MTWVAFHHGPGGINSSHTTPEWVAAANWLRAMMEISSPRGICASMTDLARAPQSIPFLTRADNHLFQIKAERA